MARVVIDYSRCTLCGLCVQYCPGHVFSINNDRVVARDEYCVECYACIPLCPTRAISIEDPDP